MVITSLKLIPGYIMDRTTPQSRQYCLSAFLLLVVGSFYIFSNLYGLNYFLANNGWSIANFVNVINHPNLYKGSFYIAQKLDYASLYIRFYSLLYNLSLPVNSLDYISIVINCLFYSAIPLMMTRYILSRWDMNVCFLVVALTIASMIRFAGLGNWGITVIGQIHYPSAYFFMTLGIICLFKDYMYRSLIFFTLSSLCHPTLGLMGAYFGACGILLDYKKYLNLKILSLILVFIIIIGGWVISTLPLSPNVLVPNAQWLSLGKIFNFHWFPVDHGFLWQRSWRHIMPFLTFVLLYHNYLKVLQIPTSLKYQFFLGGLGILLLTILGFLFSLTHSEFLIKLALQRSSSILILLGIFFVGYGLWQDICYGNWFLRISAGFTLICAFFIKGGFPVVPSLIVVLANGSLFNRKEKYITLALRITFIIVILLSLIYGIFGVANIIHDRAYMGINSLIDINHWRNIDFFISIKKYKKMILHFTLLILFLLFIFNKKMQWTKSVLLVFISILSIHFLWNRSYLSVSQDKKLANKNYYELQLWARNNTPPRSLFMIPPNGSYGWSDYSMRPSLGNMRDWLQVSWMYTSNYAVYEKGMDIYSNFNIPLKKYISYQDVKGYRELRKEIKKVYYTRNKNWFSMMAKKYKIDYFILNKMDLRSANQSLNKPSDALPCKLIYQNNSYIVCKAEE